MVNIDREAPWFGEYESFVDVLKLSSSSEKNLAYKIIRKNYKIKNSEGLVREVHKGLGWVVATGFAGQFDDDTASKLEKLTMLLNKKYNKKYNQDWNSVISSWEHPGILYFGFETLSNPEISEVVFSNILSASAFVITQGVSLYNVYWNPYRLLNRDEKARDARGFMGIASNIVMDVKNNFGDISRDFYWFAKNKGVSNWYAGLEVVVNDASREVVNKSKYLVGISSILFNK